MTAPAPKRPGRKPLPAGAGKTARVDASLLVPDPVESYFKSIASQNELMIADAVLAAINRHHDKNKLSVRTKNRIKAVILGNKQLPQAPEPPRPGRKPLPAGEGKTSRVELRVRPDTKAAWLAKAGAAGMTLQAWVERALSLAK